jgi:hypothetical protein
MTLGDILLSAFTSSLIVGVAVAVFAFVFKTTFTKWLQHGLNVDLEQFKASLKQDEERLKSALIAQNNQIEALQRGALSGMEARHTTLDRRRLEAFEKIWSAVVSMRALENSVLAIFARLKIDAIVPLAKDNKDFGEWLGVILDAAGVKEFVLKDHPVHLIQKEQLFVPPIVWAMYSAYQAVVFYPLAPLYALKGGLDPAGMVDSKATYALITAALPGVPADYLDKWGAHAFPQIAEMLRERLLHELVESLDSTMSDQQNVERAAAISALASKLLAPSGTPSPPLPKEALMQPVELETGRCPPSDPSAAAGGPGGST